MEDRNFNRGFPSSVWCSI